VTDQTAVPDAHVPQRRTALPLGRTVVWLSLAGASAALTFLVVRAMLRHAPAGDETTERIQELIDEANRLIKTLDEKKSP
jgi:hypothetical protein